MSRHQEGFQPVGHVESSLEFQAVKLAMHYMQKNEPGPATGSRGLIVCTASASGLYPFPMAPMYSISKCGVIGLVRSMAGVLGKVGIQINGLAPALVGTKYDGSRFLPMDSPPPLSPAGCFQLMDRH